MNWIIYRYYKKRLRPFEKKWYEKIANSDLFDRTYYEETNKIQKEYSQDLIFHYIRYGHKFGYRPNPLFDPRWYAEKYLPATTNPQEPLYHYIRHGRSGGNYPCEELALLDGSGQFDADYYRTAHAQLSGSDRDLLAHYLLHGSAGGRRPNPLFDPKWYRNTYLAEPKSDDEPLVHFVTKGQAAGNYPCEEIARLDRSSEFDPDYYRADNPDLAGSDRDLLTHYLLHGSSEGRRPNPLFDPKWYKAAYLIEPKSDDEPLVHFVTKGQAAGNYPCEEIARLDRSSEFDPDYYRADNPDLAGSDRDLLTHYLLHGSSEGRRPNPLFDPKWYKAAYLIEPKSDDEPLVHFVTKGQAAGNYPCEEIARLDRSNEFDLDFYRTNNPDLAGSDRDLLTHYLLHGTNEGRRPNPLFDPKWYRDTYLAEPAIDDEPLTHFIRSGLKSGYQPCEECYLLAEPGFLDLDYYRAANPDLIGDDGALTAHYLLHGSLQGRKPNAVFDPAWYRGAHPGVEEAGLEPLFHYVKWGCAEGRRPFAWADFILPRSATAHSAETAERSGRTGNRLIDNNPLHAFLHGKPHPGRPPIYDRGPLWLKSWQVTDLTYSDVVRIDTLCRNHPLLGSLDDYFLLHFTIVFDDEYYIGQAGPDAEPNPTGHYLEHGATRGLSPHPLFERDFYTADNPEIVQRGVDPFLHYVFIGAPDNRAPNRWCTAPADRDMAKRPAVETPIALIGETDLPEIPAVQRALFAANRLALGALEHRTRFSRKYFNAGDTTFEVSGDDLAAFHRCEAEMSSVGRLLLRYGGCGTSAIHYRLLDRTDLFDSAFYCDNLPDGAPAIDDPVLHYLMIGFRSGLPPCPEFDPSWYHDHYPDIAKSGVDPLVHYISWGAAEGRTPNIWFSGRVHGAEPDPDLIAETYAFDDPEAAELAAANPLLAYQARRAARPLPQILFISHDGSRTGAPLIVLNLLRAFADTEAFECFAVTLTDGDLVPHFCDTATTVSLGLDHPSNPDMTGFADHLLQPFARRPFDLVIANSIDSRFLTRHLHPTGTPIIFLVHELADMFEGPEFEALYTDADVLIFPAHRVERAARQRIPYPPDLDVRVLPQGLYKPEFLRIDEAGKTTFREAFRAEHTIPDDAHVVFACGSIDERKGIDHFVSVAIEMLQNEETGNAYHFVWLGGRNERVIAGRGLTDYFWARQDIRLAGIEHGFTFVGPTEDTVPAFMAADLYFMCSRLDPFPCVVQEAMAAGLPVVAFADNGGTQEMLAGGGGEIIPYGNVAQSVAAIRRICQTPDLAEDLGRQGRENVRTNYDFHRYAEQILDIAAQVSPAIADASGRRRTGGPIRAGRQTNA